MREWNGLRSKPAAATCPIHTCSYHSFTACSHTKFLCLEKTEKGQICIFKGIETPRGSTNIYGSLKIHSPGSNSALVSLRFRSQKSYSPAISLDMPSSCTGLLRVCLHLKEAKNKHSASSSGLQFENCRIDCF